MDELTDDLVAYYRWVLITHCSTYGAGVCRVCGVARCPDWADAYDRLASAGRAMVAAPVWERLEPRDTW